MVRWGRRQPADSVSMACPDAVAMALPAWRRAPVACPQRKDAWAPAVSTDALLALDARRKRAGGLRSAASAPAGLSPATGGRDGPASCGPTRAPAPAGSGPRAPPPARPAPMSPLFRAAPRAPARREAPRPAPGAPPGAPRGARRLCPAPPLAPADRPPALRAAPRKTAAAGRRAWPSAPRLGALPRASAGLTRSAAAARGVRNDRVWARGCPPCVRARGGPSSPWQRRAGPATTVPGLLSGPSAPCPTPEASRRMASMRPASARSAWGWGGKARWPQRPSAGGGSARGTRATRTSGGATGGGQGRRALCAPLPPVAQSRQPATCRTPSRGGQQWRALGRARQAPGWSRAAPRPLPAVHPATAGRERIGRLPTGPRLHQRRRQPWYAGARASGRPAATPGRAAGRARHTPRRPTPRKQWGMRRLDPPPGSRSGEAGGAPQPPREAKRARAQAAAGGAAPRGPAWRRGWGRCGPWGRQLPGGERGSAGRLPRARCPGGRGERGLRRVCAAGGGGGRRRGARASWRPATGGRPRRLGGAGAAAGRPGPHAARRSTRPGNSALCGAPCPSAVRPRRSRLALRGQGGGASRARRPATGHRGRTPHGRRGQGRTSRARAAPRHRGRSVGHARTRVWPHAAAAVPRPTRRRRPVRPARIGGRPAAPPASRVPRHGPGGGPTA